MATPVGGAHLTGTAVTARPSVFEILSHEGFSTALKPAVSHVVKVLAENDPGGRFGLVYRFFDELYLGFDAVVQWHYILTRGATLSEAFYGLERNLVSSEQKLSRIRLSYVISVFMPYIFSKLEKFHEQAIEEQNSTQGQKMWDLAQQRRHRNYKTFIQLYPYSKAVFKTTNLLYLLSYTFGRSDHHNLTFSFLRMTLGYTSEERSAFLESKNAELITFSKWKDPKNLPKLIARSFGESVLWMVEIGTFFIQFLDWWYHDEQRARITVSSLPIPPAPHALNSKKPQHFVTFLSSDINKCPLCRDDFRNPTAVSVSGIVYCYTCIFAYLRDDGKCPLTKLPCNTSHLIRVYR